MNTPLGALPTPIPRDRTRGVLEARACLPLQCRGAGTPTTTDHFRMQGTRALQGRTVRFSSVAAAVERAREGVGEGVAACWTGARQERGVREARNPGRSGCLYTVSARRVVPLARCGQRVTAGQHQRRDGGAGGQREAPRGPVAGGAAGSRSDWLRPVPDALAPAV